jgi:Tfp pilus assembly protein PilZ
MHAALALGLVRNEVAGFYGSRPIMSDDRRTVRRVRLPGVQVTYEGATGERHQARAVDLSREGLFIPSPRPLAVGKRLSLEIQPVGDVTAWSALGRIVWIRETDEGEERPAGMAIKIIDADDAVLAGIQHLLEAREPTERGLGTGDTVLPVRPRARSNPPAREKTMLGVGVDASATPAAPILIAAPGREPTLVGVGTGEAADAREASLAIDLVTKKPPSVRPITEVAEPMPEAPVSVAPAAPIPPVVTEPDDTAPERDSIDAPVKRSSGGGWFLLVVVLLAAGGAGYVFRDRVIVYWHMAVTAVNKQLR